MIDFKIEEKETWMCDEHKQNKIFYCTLHFQPFCPNCLKEKHKECFVNDAVHDIANVAKSLQTRCSYLQEITKEKKENIEKLEKDYENANNTGVQTKENHVALYKLMQDYMKKITTDASGKKAEQDQNVLDNAAEILTQIKKTKEEYDKLIDSYKKVAEQVETQKKAVNLKELITSYRALEHPESKVIPKKHIEIEKEIAEFNKKLKEIAVSSSPDAVKTSLDVTFKKLHDEGVETACEQGTSEFIFSTAPLSTLMSIYDLTTYKLQRKELLFNGKPFRVPYGAATTQITGRIFITGGSMDLLSQTNNCFEYILLNDELQARENLIFPRMEHSIVAINDQLLCAGGKDNKNYLKSCELCCLNTKKLKPDELSELIKKGELQKEIYKWSEVSELNEAKSFIGLCSFQNKAKNLIYAFGGLINEKALSSIEVICLSDSKPSWKKLEGMSYVNQYSMGVIQASVGGKDGILLFGGIKEGNIKAKDMYFFDVTAEGQDHDFRSQQGCELPKEEEFYNKPPVKKRMKEEIYVICLLQLYKMDLKTGKKEWIPIESS